MTPTLRSLERRLVRERAEIAVSEVVDRFLLRWDHALTGGSSPPDPLVLFKALVEAGFYWPTTHGALQYLDQCRHVASLPDRHRLLWILLPGGGGPVREWLSPGSAEVSSRCPSSS